MKTKLQFIVVVCTWLSSQVVFSAELGSYENAFVFGYGIIDEEPDVFLDEFEGNVTTVAFAHYLRPVELANYPIEEAAFLGRVASVSASYAMLNLDYSDTGVVTADFDSSDLSLSYTYAEKNLPYYLGVGLKNISTDVKDRINVNGSGSIDASMYSIEAGYFVNVTSAIAVGYMDGKLTLKPDAFENTENDISEFRVGFKSVVLLAGESAANFELEYTRDTSEDGDQEEVTKYTSLAVDYYIDRKIGVGVSYEKETTDDQLGGGKTIAFNASAYISDGLSLFGSIDKYTADDSFGSDSQFTLVGASYKF